MGKGVVSSLGMAMPCVVYAPMHVCVLLFFYGWRRERVLCPSSLLSSLRPYFSPGFLHISEILDPQWTWHITRSMTPKPKSLSRLFFSSCVGEGIWQAISYHTHCLLHYLSANPGFPSLKLEGKHWTFHQHLVSLKLLLQILCQPRQKWSLGCVLIVSALLKTLLPAGPQFYM